MQIPSRAFLRKTGIPVVRHFPGCRNCLRRSLQKLCRTHRTQLDNTPGDELLATADVIITVGYDPVEDEPLCLQSSSTRADHPRGSTRADQQNWTCMRQENDRERANPSLQGKLCGLTNMGMDTTVHADACGDRIQLPARGVRRSKSARTAPRQLIPPKRVWK
jgi:hypothetical protein